MDTSQLSIFGKKSSIIRTNNFLDKIILDVIHKKRKKNGNSTKAISSSGLNPALQLYF